MRKSNACPKCGANKDVRAKQCKICRKVEQQSTKEQTRENRFDYCACGAKKLKRANKCRNCADVDHCHTTGKFRDLLCSNCNSGLGLLKDNPDILRKAALYVEEHSR